MADRSKCSFSWGCPACSAGSTIVAEVPDLTLDEAVQLIAKKHYDASPSCDGWKDIMIINLGGCPFFGPEPDGTTPDAPKETKRPVPARFRR
jgi:hypothetical protein